MEPVNRAAELGNDLSETVIAAHVRELMKQHDSSPIVVPFIRIGGKKHHWIEYAPRRRHCGGRAQKNSHASADAELSGDLRLEIVPLRLVHCDCATSYPSQGQEATNDGDQTCRDSAEPDQCE
jgi:hypothetical protein